MSWFKASDDAECVAVVLNPRDTLAVLIIQDKASSEKASIALHQQNDALVLSGFNVDQ
jgi:hypothetical protein